MKIQITFEFRRNTGNNCTATDKPQNSIKLDTLIFVLIPKEFLIIQRLILTKDQRPVPVKSDLDSLTLDSLTHKKKVDSLTSDSLIHKNFLTRTVSRTRRALA